MLAGEEELVRAWYHEHLPGGMAGDWRKQASNIERGAGGIALKDVRRARMLRRCAELSIQRRLHISFIGDSSDYSNCVWCHTGASHGA